MSIFISGKLNKAEASLRGELKGTQNQTRTTREEFTKTLAAALGKAAPASGGSPLKVAAAKLMRLEMQRGALLEEDPGGENARFSALSNIRLPQPDSLHVSQKYDQGLDKSQARPRAKRSADSMINRLERVKAQPGAKRSANSRSLESVINRAAERHGIEPALVKAVIKAESGFDHQAVSRAGARGLMQLMPDTAKDLGVTNSFDAHQNVMAGTRYLKQLLDRYEGNLDSALAAYNWGPGNVDRKGIASLPEETRTYLARVKTYYNDYTTV